MRISNLLSGQRVPLPICDDQLYVKPTASGRLLAEPVLEALPYPGAKPHLLIEPDRWNDTEWLGGLLRVTAAELPIPKPSQLSGQETLYLHGL